MDDKIANHAANQAANSSTPEELPVTANERTPTANERAPSEQSAEVRGLVEYRLGDGPLLVLRRGPVKVTTTDMDATLSWQDGETHASASMPLADFRRYVADGAITTGTAGR